MRIFILMAGLLSLPAVFANEETDLIKRISSDINDVSILWPDQSWGEQANNDCSTGTGVVVIDTSNESGEKMLSLALAAKMANKQVKVTVSPKLCKPVGGWAPVVERIDVY